MIKNQNNNDIEEVLMISEPETNVLGGIINLLTTPIAKRKGVFISADDCKEWVQDFRDFAEKYNLPLIEQN